MHRFLTASIEILRIRRSGVRLHLSFVALAALLLFSAPDAEGVARSLRMLGFLFGCVTVHAVASRAAGRLAGGAFEPVLLWPLGNLARDPVPASVHVTGAAAGGGISSLLALYGLFSAFGQEGAARTAGLLLSMNLIPAPPFDAGRLARAWLVERKGPSWGHRVAASAAFLAAVFLCLAGALWGTLEAIAIALFLAGWNAAEWRDFRLARASGEAGGPADVEQDFVAELEREEAERARRAHSGLRARWGRGVSAVRDWAADRADARDARRERRLRARVDTLLAKVGRSGMDGLTWRERRELKRASRRYKRFLAGRD